MHDFSVYKRSKKSLIAALMFLISLHPTSIRISPWSWAFDKTYTLSLTQGKKM